MIAPRAHDVLLYLLVISVFSGCAQRLRSPESWAHARGNWADATPVASTCRPPDGVAQRRNPTRDDVLRLARLATDSVIECGERYRIEYMTVYVRFFIDGRTGGIVSVDTLPEDLRFQRCVAPAYAEACTQPFTLEQFRVSFPYKLP